MEVETRGQAMKNRKQNQKAEREDFSRTYPDSVAGIAWRLSAKVVSSPDSYRDDHPDRIKKLASF